MLLVDHLHHTNHSAADTDRHAQYRLCNVPDTSSEIESWYVIVATFHLTDQMCFAFSWSKVNGNKCRWRLSATQSAHLCRGWSARPCRRRQRWESPLSRQRGRRYPCQSGTLERGDNIHGMWRRGQYYIFIEKSELLKIDRYGIGVNIYIYSYFVICVIMIITICQLNHPLLLSACSSILNQVITKQQQKISHNQQQKVSFIDQSSKHIL